MNDYSDCPDAENHGNPFRYCPVKGCGWMEEPAQGEPITGMLESIAIPRRKTGVIVGLSTNVTQDLAYKIHQRLSIRFPQVRFAVVSGASSVAFEWDEPVEVPE